MPLAETDRVRQPRLSRFDPINALESMGPPAKAIAERAWVALDPVSGLRDAFSIALRPASFRKRGILTARLETIRFVRTFPRTARSFVLPSLLREWTVSQADARGLFLEFGVGDGESTNHIARTMQRSHPGTALHAFDSFRGLPEKWLPWADAGAFAREALPTVEPNAHLVVGLFQDTLANFLASHPGVVSFAHIDCDLYSSAHYVLHSLLANSRLAPGSLLLFDELMNYPGWITDGEYRALRELLPGGPLGYEIIGAAPVSEQVAIRLTAVAPRGPQR